MGSSDAGLYNEGMKLAARSKSAMAKITRFISDLSCNKSCFINHTSAAATSRMVSISHMGWKREKAEGQFCDA